MKYTRLYECVCCGEITSSDIVHTSARCWSPTLDELLAKVNEKEEQISQYVPD